MRLRFIILLAVVWMFVGLDHLHGQLFVGPNVGAIGGRSLEAGLMYYPKNHDWIAVTLGGGFTVNGPMYFARRKAECLHKFHNGGWHMRLGLRNGFTTDHHANHIFWGADLVYSRQIEDAIINSCDTSSIPESKFSQSIDVMSVSVNFGYTWNPLRKKTIYQRFLVDFGMRIGYPFWSSAPPLGQRDYFSGMGFTWFPIRSITFQPIASFRWELFHGRYGYSKGQTRKRYK